MTTRIRNRRPVPRPQCPLRRHSCRPKIEHLEDRTVPSGFVQTALMSDIPGLAANTNKSFLNPWQFVETPAGQFRVALNGAGQAMLLDAQGEKTGADIMIPAPAGSPAGTVAAPTGVVGNSTSGFVISFKGRTAPATLIFDSEDGTIAAWNPSLSQTRAVIANDQSAGGAVYKGLAMGSSGSANYLYATNFHNGTVDVFDSRFAVHRFSADQFTDPNPPADFAPFGIKNFDGVLFVTFAKQNAEKHDDVAGPGNGFIDEFDTSGHFLTRLASGTAAGGTLTALNSPFGMALAPTGFGSFGHDLLVGNFGDSHVSAFNVVSGAFVSQLSDGHGNPLVLNGGFQETSTKGLWGIAFGNGAAGTSASTLFFAAGINDESDGLFGMVNFDPPGSGRSSSADVGIDLPDLEADVTAIARALAGIQVSAAVTADVNALSAALSKVVADLAAGRLASGDIQTAQAAVAKLSVDLGTSVQPTLRHAADLGNDLLDLSITAPL
jgi:uncharacterized protein (TIGR03118 family)